MTDTNGDGIDDALQGNSSAMSAYMAQLSQGGYLTPGGGVPSLGIPGNTASADNPLIYLGTRDVSAIPGNGYMHIGIGDFATTKAPDTATPEQMLQNLEHMSIPEQHKLYAQLLIAGFSGSTVPLNKIAEEVKNSAFQDLAASYQSFLQDLAERYSTRGQEITPDELLKQRIAFRFKAAGIDWNGNLDSLSLSNITKLTEDPAASLAGTRTSSYTSKDFMDPMDAKALVRATLQRELGRDPTAAEYEDFVSAIHGAQAQDPSRTTQTVTTDDQGRVISQNSVTHEGMSAAGVGQLALERAQRQPDWAEWQAMGTYAPALFAALGSTVPGT